MKDGALLGPPTVEFAPYGRVPNSRGRKDLRQGTIDQDQEFIDFLESLTSPISKPAPVDQGTDSAGKIKEKVTVTPLVQYLKDKKANKGKEITIASKTTKHTRQDSKDSKTSTIEKRPSSKASNPILSPEKRSAQALKVEKAARDVVRVISKQALTTTKGSTSPSTSTTTTSTTTTTPIPNPSVANVTPIEKKRERGSMSAAAKILQRDLGLGGSPGGRGGRRGPPSKPATNASNPAVPKQDSSPVESSKVTVANNTIASTNDEAKTLVNSTNKPSINSQPPRGPATSSGSPRTPSSSGPKSGHSGPANNIVKNTISPTATQAFLKHANPSQGITEPLLEQAFSEFGVVKKVEIDKKKGFAYVDFAEPQGLQDAVKASPIKVASGQVVVLERKTGPTLQARNARGRSYVMMGNRGGGTPTGPRGGRGGSVKRGGLGRGGANAAHPTIYKAPTTGPTTSQATIAAPAADPAVSQSSTETNIGLPAPTPIEVIDNTPDA